ncbi:hypothetical protein EV356DRAFT_579747 [Viridothelium virens]|uniref:Amino acid transporter n=1 Tax=Viridothelium virens TaxID=1048519 RepID=A0A6A6GY50_VIRVR|nr:hypothetical protein EV356DRAFT_579747 [Viridothelium virens]
MAGAPEFAVQNHCIDGHHRQISFHPPSILLADEDTSIDHQTDRMADSLNTVPTVPDLQASHSSNHDVIALSDLNRRRRLSESDTVVPRRNLKVIDVAALILNKMIGSGIFTTPGAVLIATKSKPVSLVLWVVGGIYSVLCLIIYLEYAIALPFNGGEIIYLDEIYRKPDMLATVLYAGIFIALANTAGNAFAFAKLVLVAAQHVEPSTPVNLEPALVRTLAISIVTAVCFLHYTWSRLGLFFNKAFALYKIILCLVVFGAGVRAWNKAGSGMTGGEDFGRTYSGGTDGLAALVTIFYAYEGWENATYVSPLYVISFAEQLTFMEQVAGEIHALRVSPGRSTSSSTLRWGAMLAVVVVTLLYFLVAFGYYTACSYTDITNADNDLGMAIYLAHQIWGSTHGLSVAFALSAVGNLIAVIYTFSKVKQAIAVQRILPFWSFLEKDSENPRGALVLHWLVTTIFILACPTSADGYNFVIGINEYARIIITLFIAAGFLVLHTRMDKDWKPQSWLLRRVWLRFVFVVLFLGLNMLVVVYGPMQRLDNGEFSIDRMWWPCIFFIILAGSFLYWMLLTVPQWRKGKSGQVVGESLGFEVTVYRDTDSRDSWPTHMWGPMTQARLDGTGRRIEYKLSGNLARVAERLTKVRRYFEEYIW